MSVAAIHSAAISITSASGKSGGSGTIQFSQPTFGQRLARAGIIFLLGLGGGLLFLPVPLMHLLGLFFFLVLTGVAAKRLVTLRVLQGASGSCPSCGKESRFFVGFGGRGVKFPIKTDCKHCHTALRLWPPQA